MLGLSIATPRTRRRHDQAATTRPVMTVASNASDATSRDLDASRSARVQEALPLTSDSGMKALSLPVPYPTGRLIVIRSPA